MNARFKDFCKVCKYLFEKNNVFYVDFMSKQIIKLLSLTAYQSLNVYNFKS
jgi:hypothetical protein